MININDGTLLPIYPSIHAVLYGVVILSVVLFILMILMRKHRNKILIPWIVAWAISFAFYLYVLRLTMAYYVEVILSLILMFVALYIRFRHPITSIPKDITKMKKQQTQ